MNQANLKTQLTPKNQTKENTVIGYKWTKQIWIRLKKIFVYIYLTNKVKQVVNKPSKFEFNSRKYLFMFI